MITEETLDEGSSHRGKPRCLSLSKSLYVIRLSFKPSGLVISQEAVITEESLVKNSNHRGNPRCGQDPQNLKKKIDIPDLSFLSHFWRFQKIQDTRNICFATNCGQGAHKIGRLFPGPRSSLKLLSPVTLFDLSTKIVIS